MTALPLDSKLKNHVFGLLSVLLAVCVHFQAMQGAAVLDDHAVFLENPLVQDDFDLQKIFSSNVFGGRAGFEKAGGYRPLTILSFRLGPSDSLAVQRTLNVLFHALGVWMLWLLARLLGLKRLAAGVAAMVFAVHPIHVDAIVPLNNRSDLLCTFFVLAALVLWLKSRERRIGFMAILCGLLAALSKEQGLLTPLFLAIPTIIWWRQIYLDGAGDRVVRWRWGFLGLGVLLSGLVLFMRYQALGGSITGLVPASDNPLVDADLAGRVLAPGTYVLKALSLCLWPLSLSADYTRDALPLPLEWSELKGWVGLALFGFWSVYVLRCMWKARMIHAVCFGGSLLAYGVTSNLVVLSTISFSERALYLPSAFLVLGLGWLIQGWLRQGEKISAPGMILVASVILCLSGLSLMRVTDYASNQAIANTSLEHTPRSARLWSMLGESLRKEGRFDDADRAYRQALLFDPDSASAFRGRGLVAFARKRYQQAAQWHDRAIDKSQGGMVDAYNDACLAYLRANDFDRALRRCNAGLSRAPNENLLMTNVSRVYLAQDNLKAARKWAQKGYERSPQNFYSLWHLLLVTLKSGDENHAKVLWNRAKKQKPGDQKLLQFGQQFGLE